MSACIYPMLCIILYYYNYSQYIMTYCRSPCMQTLNYYLNVLIACLHGQLHVLPYYRWLLSDVIIFLHFAIAVCNLDTLMLGVISNLMLIWRLSFRLKMVNIIMYSLVCFASSLHFSVSILLCNSAMISSW